MEEVWLVTAERRCGTTVVGVFRRLKTARQQARMAAAERGCQELEEVEEDDDFNVIERDALGQLPDGKAVREVTLKGEGATAYWTFTVRPCRVR